MATKTVYIPIHELSRKLGLPNEWLKRQAEAGRLPAIRCGRRLMFPSEQVEQALEQMAIGKDADHATSTR